MTSPNSATPLNRPSVKRGPSFSKKLLLWTRTLHIYFSVLALLMLMFFAMTGFMMNHEDFFGVDKQTTSEIKDKIPDEIMSKPGGLSRELAIVEYLREKLRAYGEVDKSGINDETGRVSFKGPHYSFDVEIDKTDGTATITKTADSFSGWITNLHKGSDTGEAWHRVIDGVSMSLAFISLTGLILWLSLAKRRTLGIVSLAICVVAVVGVFWFFVP